MSYLFQHGGVDFPNHNRDLVDWTYQTNFATDDWTDAGSGTGINTGTQKMDFALVNGTNTASAYDLTSISDTAFVYRYDVNFTTLTSLDANLPAAIMGLASGNQTVVFTGVQDILAIEWQYGSIAKNYYAFGSDGGVFDSDSSVALAWATSTDYFFQGIRLSATSFSMSRYPDNSYSSASDSVTNTIASTIQGLRYAKIQNYDGASGGVMTGTMDNFKFANGVTTPP